MKKVAVLGSGKGTNFLAILKRASRKAWDAEFLAISDKKDSAFIEKAKSEGVKFEVLPTEKRDEKLLEILKSFSPDLIVLAGYMKILPSAIVKTFEGKIVNLHPSLLPAFKGAHAIRDAFEYGVKWTGVTVHFVNEELDAGPIIAQVPVELRQNDTLESLQERIHDAEHELYPRVVEKILFGGEKFESAFERK